MSTSIAIYEADADDYAPNAYTFDGSTATERFMKLVDPYLKNPQVYLCPEDNAPSGIFAEGISGKLSYAHCQSLKKVIPNFEKGGRALLTSKIGDPATVAYIRDPIRGFVDDEKAKVSGFFSPHGEMFNTAYLDTHAKRIPHPKEERGF